MIESRHLGAAIVLSPDGSQLRMLGNADAVFYPRSSLKPVQAVAVLRSGAELDGEQLALATASHSGTEEHQRVAREILSRAGLTESDLGCPEDWPSDPAAAATARTSGRRRRLAMNCSGKHAAFLLACAHNGWPIDDYLDPLHPLQRLIVTVVEEFTGAPIAHFGTDGCGAPLFGITLRGLATAVSRVAVGAEDSTARLVSAILANPWAVDGPGRANTVVIEELGLIAKLGAEGVNVMAARDGTTVAVKMLDGNGRATTLVALELLASVGAIDSALARQVAERTTERVLGGSEPVGGFRATF
jgi:L-asparaginase II